MEVEQIMTTVKSGRRNILPPHLDDPGDKIAVLAAQWEPKTCLALLSYEGPYRRSDVRITTASIQGEDMPQVTRSLAIWEGPRQLQEQFNRRLTDISSMIEPVQAKFAEFLGDFSCDERLVSTIGLSPADTGCFNPWAVVLGQGDRKAVFTGKKSSALTKTYSGVIETSEWVLCIGCRVD